MKHKHRILALSALLAVGAAALLGSCSGGDVTAETSAVTDPTETAAVTETAAPQLDRLEELGERDLEGWGYTVLDSNPNYAMHINIPGETQTGEIINDTLWTRDAAIEERYNVKINYLQETSRGASILKSSVLAGDADFNLVFATGGELRNHATAGLLANMMDMEHLSLDQKWWSSLMYDNLRLKDTMYFTTGDINPTMYQIAACMFVNTKLVDDYDINCDFVKEVHNGTWTWDLVGELSRGINQDLNEDGKWAYKDDLFGCIGCFSTYLMPACDVEYCTVTDGGSNLALTAVSEQTVAIVDKLRGVFEPTNPKSVGSDFADSAFKEDRALFLTVITECAVVHLRDMESDYLILPVAKFDETQEGYRTGVNIWATAFVGVPKTADDEKTGFVTEALAAWSHTNMRPIAFDLTYKAKTVRDERSIEMLDIVFDNLYLSFADVYDFGGISSVFWDILATGGDLVSQIEKITPKAEKEMQAFVASWGNAE